MNVMSGDFEGHRTATVLVDDNVDLGHEANGFGEGNDDLVVVGDVVVGKGTVLAVLEPFPGNLVTADMEFSRRLGYASSFILHTFFLWQSVDGGAK